MNPNTNERQERIDREGRSSADSRAVESPANDHEPRADAIATTDGRTSPSAGWREVYAAMGVSSTGDVEDRSSTIREESDGPNETNRISKPNGGAGGVPTRS